jgi:hypothetical protein
MFVDVLNALDNGTEPMETFYDGYVVNAVIDACYRSAKSKQWEPVELEIWRGADQVKEATALADTVDEQYVLVKQERMPDGRTRLILKDKESRDIIQKIEDVS